MLLLKRFDVIPTVPHDGGNIEVSSVYLCFAFTTAASFSVACEESFDFITKHLGTEAIE